jgi:hypothetical protein
MLGVIVCPRCTLVQGADLTTARTTCPRCGKRIEVRKAKVYFSTDSPRELAEGVRQVGQRLIYDVERPGDAPEPPAESRSPRSDRALRPLALQLLAEREEVSREDIRLVLGEVSEEDLEQILSQLLGSGLMYEVSPGRYRAT